MGIDIPLFNSCCYYFSLRTGVIVVGSIQLFLYSLYIVDILIYRLRIPLEDQNEQYLFLMNVIMFDYAEIIQLSFNCLLIYGALKGKSSFILAWLLTGVAEMIDAIWNTVVVSIWSFHWGFFLEQFIYMAISITALWIVYSFYSTMPKSKYIL